METTAVVELIAVEGATYEAGAGNLCASCHQPLSAFTAVDGVVNISSTHWGPHHGPQSAMLLGVGGAGVEGSPSMHYNLVEDGCVNCHMGENQEHTFEPQMASCLACHADAESFDLNGVQTEVEALVEELRALLVANDLWDDEEDENIVGEFPEAQAAAVWNYIYIVNEDGSMGAHNSDYTIALLEASIAALQP